LVASDLEALWDAEWREDQVERTLVRLKERVNEKQFQMFYLHVIRDLTTAEVVRRLNVNAAQVYLNKFRVGPEFRRLLSQVQLEDQQPGVPTCAPPAVRLAR
jgi:hypothetical protein